MSDCDTTTGDKPGGVIIFFDLVFGKFNGIVELEDINGGIFTLGRIGGGIFVFVNGAKFILSAISRGVTGSCKGIVGVETFSCLEFCWERVREGRRRGIVSSSDVDDVL